MALCARIFNAKLRTCIVKVGRAVHCAPGLAMQARLPGLNLVFRALTGAATECAHLGRSKFRGEWRGCVRPGCRARFGLHQTLANVGVGSATESKTVLQHHNADCLRALTKLSVQNPPGRYPSRGSCQIAKRKRLNWFTARSRMWR